MPKKQNYIVCLGSSAGGLEAYKIFFSSFTGTYINANIAYVIVSHLSPNYNNSLVDIVSKFTDLAVEEVKHNTKIKPNYVYIIPPNKELRVKDDEVFSLRLRSKTEPIFHPINIFFESVSNTLKERAICVLLSGTGADGTVGLKKVKENGGFVIVADPNLSKFDGMPKNAISTGLVDLVLSPKYINRGILSYINGNENIFINPEIASSGESLEQIFELINEATGIDFRHYKINTILRRLQRRIAVNKFSDLEKYIIFLKENVDEVFKLKKEFLIGVSSFFRDKNAYKTIQNKVIPQIFKQVPKEKAIRIWCCGALKGEEAYSIAILIKEYMEKNTISRPIKIFATDINKSALEAGNLGKFDLDEIKNIPKRIFKKHFTVTSNYTFQVNQGIRDMVVFAYHNIFKDPPFTKIDLICCRNMLIYIKPKVQQKLIAIFHYSINDNGFLFLGSSETLGNYNGGDFETIDRKFKIYKFQQTAKHISNNMFGSMVTSKKNNQNYFPMVNTPTQSTKLSERTLNKSLMQRYIPPSIFVNSKMELIHVFGDLKPYLNLPNNTVKLNVETMIIESLKILVLTGLRQCFQKQNPIYYSKVACVLDGEPAVIDVQILYNIDTLLDLNLVQISFIHTSTKMENDNEYIKFDLEKYSKNYISGLELQLKEGKEDLETIAEEMERTNEELQTVNEELLSANEEMQSTNEELQSVNEELLMINNEHQEKIKELTLLNDDINNLLENIDASTIFLDKNLNIRRFTDSLGLGLQLRKRDIGRPIQEISLRLKYKELKSDIQNVLLTEKKISKEIMNGDGQWIMMNILPYYTLSRINGVVITYYNVTTLKNLSQVYEATAKEYSEKEEKLNLLLEGYPDLIIEFDEQANILATINGKKYKSPIVPESTIEPQGSINKLLVSKNLSDLQFIPKNLKKGLLDAINETLKNETRNKKILKVKNIEKKYSYLEIRTQPINNNNVTCIIRDITELQIAQKNLDKKIAELRKTNEKLQQYIDSNLELEKFAYIASHDMKEPLRGIISFSQLIKKKIEENDFTNIEEFLDLIVTSGKRMFKLTEEMLEYSRVDTKDFNPQIIDLNILLNEIIADFNVSVQSRNIAIEIDDMGEFYGDEMLIRETFANLISNAIKFNNKEKPIVQVKNQSTKTKWIYKVIDNGIGINKSFFDTIFLLFKRLHTKDDFEGTGLGLSICKKAVEKHKGIIKINSTVKKGTTFTISIPKVK